MSGHKPGISFISSLVGASGDPGKTIVPTVLTSATSDSAGAPPQRSIASDRARRTRGSSNGFFLWFISRRLPQFQSDVTQLAQRLDNLRAVLPEEKDVADILRRVQGLATQSSLNIQRFTPQAPQQEALYAALPYKLKAEGTYNNLGLFFDRISKFPRIINVGDITIKAKQTPEANATIDAECTATTFVLQESKAPAGGRGGRGMVPQQPSSK